MFGGSGCRNIPQNTKVLPWLSLDDLRCPALTPSMRSWWPAEPLAPTEEEDEKAEPQQHDFWAELFVWHVRHIYETWQRKRGRGRFWCGWPWRTALFSKWCSGLLRQQHFESAFPVFPCHSQTVWWSARMQHSATMQPCVVSCTYDTEMYNWGSRRIASPKQNPASAAPRMTWSVTVP